MMKLLSVLQTKVSSCVSGFSVHVHKTFVFAIYCFYYHILYVSCLILFTKIPSVCFNSAQLLRVTYMIVDCRVNPA